MIGACRRRRRRRRFMGIDEKEEGVHLSDAWMTGLSDRERESGRSGGF